LRVALYPSAGRMAGPTGMAFLRLRSPLPRSSVSCRFLR